MSSFTNRIMVTLFLTVFPSISTLKNSLDILINLIQMLIEFEGHKNDFFFLSYYFFPKLRK